MPRRTSTRDEPTTRRTSFHNKRRALATSDRERAYAEMDAVRAAIAKLQPESARNAAWQEFEQMLAGFRARIESRGQR